MRRTSEDANAKDMSLDEHYKVINVSTLEQDEASPLCCCEYRNVHGQRTHLLAFCCDCEDLDNAVDQCFKGNRVSSQTWVKVSEVIADRIRVPWPSGGAKRIEIGAFLPVFVLPVSLYLASFGLVFTVLTLVYIPVFVVGYYVYALRQRKRTWFFVAWGYVSVLGMFGLFLYHVAPACSLMNTTGISLGFGLMMVCYTQVVLSKSWLPRFGVNSGPIRARGVDGNKGMQHLTCCFCTLGPFERSKHCRICGYCVPKSDHHCVWTNCCIGQHNQRQFLLAIFLFVVTGSWGISLCLATVCQPDDVNSSQFDCSEVYSQAGSASVFVASFYGVMFIISMSALLAQQLLFVSFNVTTDEWKRTVRKRKKTFWEALQASPHNKGLLKNWMEFLFHRDVNQEGLKEII